MFAINEALTIGARRPSPAVQRHVVPRAWHRLSTDLRRALTSPTIYLDSVVVFGLLVIARSIGSVAVNPPGAEWFVLAGLTVLSGAATLRMPHVPITFSISDTFTITAALLFGPTAGALTVTIDALVMSLRLSRHHRSVRRFLFNAAAPALAM